MRNRSLKRQKAINYLLKHPDATARAVAKHSGLSMPTVYKIIKQRQTPLAVLVGEAIAKATADPPGVVLLKEATETVKERSKSYGDMGESISRIAHVWSALTGHPITASEAARMLIGLKLARLKAHPHHHDSIVDIAGYAAVLAEAVKRETED